MGHNGPMPNAVIAAQEGDDEEGKATGVVTSVQLSHATPSTFAAQNISRKNMTALAHDMLTNGSIEIVAPFVYSIDKRRR